MDNKNKIFNVLNDLKNDCDYGNYIDVFTSNAIILKQLDKPRFYDIAKYYKTRKERNYELIFCERLSEEEKIKFEEIRDWFINCGFLYYDYLLRKKDGNFSVMKVDVNKINQYLERFN